MKKSLLLPVIGAALLACSTLVYGYWTDEITLKASVSLLYPLDVTVEEPLILPLPRPAGPGDEAPEGAGETPDTQPPGEDGQMPAPEPAEDAVPGRGPAAPAPSSEAPGGEAGAQDGGE